MDKINNILRKLNFSPEKEELRGIDKKVSAFSSLLKKNFPAGSIFLGGSFAKNTLVKKKIYDVDIFVRLEKSKFDLKKLESAVKKTAAKFGYKTSKIYGSREYYRVKVDSNLVFEVVPALKISKPKEAENVIDLSYFHVSYVKKQIAKNKRLASEIRLAKTFLMSCGVYGAESYIRGFSGYTVECLMINYKTLSNMLKGIVNAEGKIIIDSAKQYKKKADIIYHINESKLTGPVVIVDPTWKERNVAAAVSQESFDKLKAVAQKFLKSPSESFFEEKVFLQGRFEQQTNKDETYFNILIETDKQEGDIAGTKLKKFSNYLLKALENRLIIVKSHFEYEGNREAHLHIISKPRTEIIHKGPPADMKESASAFRKEHKSVFVKDKRLFAKEKNTKSANRILSEVLAKEKIKAKQMSVVSLRLN